VSAESLRDILRTFVENIPDDDELAKRPLPRGPNPTTYPGRPNWCGGALLVDRDPRTGQRVDKRVRCNGTAEPGTVLCCVCADREAKQRQALRDKAMEARQPSRPKGRGYREEAAE
jgi:hypothetical protein